MAAARCGSGDPRLPAAGWPADHAMAFMYAMRVKSGVFPCAVAATGLSEEEGSEKGA